MSENKYDGNGEIKTKLLMGVVMEGDKLMLKLDDTAPMSELIRFWGILTVEMPFLLQQIKYMKAKQESSGIVVPNKG